MKDIIKDWRRLVAIAIIITFPYIVAVSVFVIALTHIITIDNYGYGNISVIFKY